MSTQLKTCSGLIADISSIHAIIRLHSIDFEASNERERIECAYRTAVTVPAGVVTT